MGVNICTTIACMTTQICASSMNRNSMIAANASRLNLQKSARDEEQKKQKNRVIIKVPLDKKGNPRW